MGRNILVVYYLILYSLWNFILATNLFSSDVTIDQI